MAAKPPDAATFAAHRSSPDVSLDQHVNKRVIELGQSLDSRTAIYLDTKFWVLLRKAANGQNIEPADAELLQMLRSLASEGKVFCPISESIFFELMKQEDVCSRMDTARLIDELSQGISLLPHEVRMATEIGYFLHFAMGDNLHPPRHLVWLKLAHMLGFMHPSAAGFDPETELVVQKAFFDHMWTIPLEDMVRTIGKNAWDRLDFDDLARDLNHGVSQHADEIRSFSQAYAAELRGAAEACGDMAAQIVCDMGQKRTGLPPPERGSAQWQELRRKLENALFYALKKRPQTRLQLRMLNIEACLHAAFRWDKQRRFTGNDIYDFHHASAGLGYCRAFFTEHPLRSTVTANHVALDRLYGCSVISETSEAIAFLNSQEASCPYAA